MSNAHNQIAILFISVRVEHRFVGLIAFVVCSRIGTISTPDLAFQVLGTKEPLK